MRIVPIACLADNYAYLVVCGKTGETAIVDASEAPPVLAAARRENLKPRAIWSTHHHADHVGGNVEVQETLGISDVFGHAHDQNRIAGLSRPLEDGASFTMGAVRVRVMHIPGHTLGAIAYVCEDEGSRAVFTGDTLFLAGCGRLFEGTPAQMWKSLSGLAALAGDTEVYCGHEYTESNLRFAEHVEPHNEAIGARVRKVRELRAAGQPTVPGTMADERATNPFLRVGSTEIRRAMNLGAEASDVDVFAALRRAKDTFR